MTYRVRVLRVEVAEFAITVGDPATLGRRPAIAVHAAVHTTGLAALVRRVKAEFTSWIDMSTGRALAFRAEETAGKDDPTVESMDVRFDQLAGGRFPVVSVRPDAEGAPQRTVEQQSTREQPLDLLSLLIQLRAWDKPGRASFVTLRSSHLWRTDVRTAGRESLKTELGNLPALRFELDSRRMNRDGSFDRNTEPRHLVIWISDDADRVPLKLVAPTDYGMIEMAIAEYVPGPLPNLASVARTQ
jgi:hypothetical protein